MPATVKEIEGFEKPYKDFPFTRHAKKGWYKRINGKVRFICPPCHYEKALEVWFEKKKAFQPEVSGQVIEAAILPLPPSPKPAPVSITVPELRDRFLKFKEERFQTGQMAARSVHSTTEAIRRFAKRFKKGVDALTTEDFATYRHELASKLTVLTIDRHIIQVRSMFRWAVANGVISLPPELGDELR